MMGLLCAFWMLAAVAQSSVDLPFATFFERQKVVMLLIDPDSGAIVDANPAAERFYGYSREQLRQMAIQEINTFTPEQIAEERARAAAEQRNYFIFRHRLADGSIRTVEVYSHPYPVSGRTLLVSTIFDITPGRNLNEAMWHYQARLEELVDARTAALQRANFWLIAALLGLVLLTAALAFAYVRLRALNARLRLAAAVFEHSHEGIIIADANANIVQVNPAFTRITGYDAHEVIGKNPRILASGKHDKAFYAAMWQALLTQGHWSGEIWNRRKNGEVIAEFETISVVRNQRHELTHFIAQFVDVTPLKEYQQQLERLAHYDALTGLPNRLLLGDRLRQAILMADRHGTQVAVVFIDVDGFKGVNDTLGHEAGDRLLRALSERMLSCLRAVDTLARLGGDEFVAVLTELHSREEARSIAERMLEAASSPVAFGETTVAVSASIGMSFYPQAERLDGEQLLRQADQAMYQAKLAGKNRISVFDAQRDQDVRLHFSVIDEVRRALARDEFVLYYQPKVDMRTGAVLGAEALLRWQHPQRGLMLPGAFLPHLSDHPLMLELGEWVLAAALKEAKEWQRRGLNVPVAVNLDPQQLIAPNFVSRLETIVQTCHADFADLTLEILESSALHDFQRAVQQMLQLRARNATLSIDDFGAGYSSLLYLKQLPVSELKVDMAFVRDVLDDPEDLTILYGVSELAAAFDLNTVAEGVESLEHGKMLLRLGYRAGQGFGIARPMPVTEFLRWLKTWQPPSAWQNVPVVSKDRFVLLRAAVEHRAWMNQMRAHFASPHTQPPPELDSTRCRFGRWWQAGGEALCTPQARAEITERHEAVHRVGGQLVAALRRGDHDEAQRLGSQLVVLCDGLVALLLAQAER